MQTTTIQCAFPKGTSGGHRREGGERTGRAPEVDIWSTRLSQTEENLWAPEIESSHRRPCI